MLMQQPMSCAILIHIIQERITEQWLSLNFYSMVDKPHIIFFCRCCCSCQVGPKDLIPAALPVINITDSLSSMPLFAESLNSSVKINTHPSNASLSFDYLSYSTYLTFFIVFAFDLLKTVYKSFCGPRFVTVLWSVRSVNTNKIVSDYPTVCMYAYGVPRWSNMLWSTIIAFAMAPQNKSIILNNHLWGENNGITHAQLGQ